MKNDVKDNISYANNCTNRSASNTCAQIGNKLSGQVMLNHFLISLSKKRHTQTANYDCFVMPNLMCLEFNVNCYSMFENFLAYFKINRNCLTRSFL